MLLLLSPAPHTHSLFWCRVRASWAVCLAALSRLCFLVCVSLVFCCSLLLTCTNRNFRKCIEGAETPEDRNEQWGKYCSFYAQRFGLFRREVHEVFEESLQGVSPTSLATDPQFYKRAMEMCILRDDRLLVHKYCAQHGIGVGTEKFYINFAEELREQDLSLGLLYHLAKEKYVQLC